MFPHGEQVVILRPAFVVDRYGNETPDWSNPAEYTLVSCAIAPGTVVEDTDGREHGVEADYTLYVSPDAGTGIYGWSVYGEPIEAIHPTDRLRFRGQDHEVVGRIDVWHQPFTGWRPGCVVRATIVEG